MLTVALVSLLWVEYKFNCDITGLRKVVKMREKSMSTTDHQITIREVADDVGISFGSFQTIFTDVLGIKHAAVKIIPKLLNFDWKQCTYIAQQQRSRFAPKKVITVDESWVFGFDIEIAQEMLMTFYDDPDLLKKVIIGGESWMHGPEE